MRGLAMLSVGGLAACGILAGTPCRAWPAWRQLVRAEVRYVESIEGAPSPFAELAGGGRIAEHARGWAYDQALFLPDVDGDGCADLALVASRPSSCGNDTEGGIEVYSGAGLTLLGEHRGPVHFALDVSRGGEILESRTDCNVITEVSVRAALRADRRWSRPLEGFGTRFAGDLDGDGHEDVGSWGANGDSGEVRVCSGRDGRSLWRARLPSAHMEAAPTGDWDRDGCPDVLALSGRSVAILSGRGGATLTRGELPGGHWVDLSRAGDVDGDGQVDFCCRGIGLRGARYWAVHSSRTWERLDVAGGWRILWCAEQGDLDGDGADDLVLGRVDEETKERRVSIYSSAGLVDVRFVAEDEPRWENLGASDLGRFREDGPWHVLLPMWNGNGSLWQGRGFTVVYQID